MALVFSLLGTAAATWVLVPEGPETGTKQVVREGAESAKKKKKKKKKKRGPRGPQGSQGAQGLQGPQGLQGAEGPSALRLDYDQPRGTGVTAIGTQDELTISASCGPLIDTTTMALQVTSSVDAEISYVSSRDSGGVPTMDNETLPLNANAPLVLFNDDASGPVFVRRELSVVYRNPNRVISLQLHTVVDNTTERCKVQGTAVPAS